MPPAAVAPSVPSSSQETKSPTGEGTILTPDSTKGQSPKKKFRYKFRLLHGKHKGKDSFRREDTGELVNNNDGKIYHAPCPEMPETMLPDYKGNIIECDENLALIFGTEKFRDITGGEGNLSNSTEQLRQEIREREERLAEIERQESKDRSFGSHTFEEMTLEELKTHAIEVEVDLGKARSKEEIIKVLKAALVSA